MWDQISTGIVEIEDYLSVKNYSHMEWVTKTRENGSGMFELNISGCLDNVVTNLFGSKMMSR